MCGIAGFIERSGAAGDAAARLRDMLRTIGHRGPDDEGCWIDSAKGVALGHRRLSILELSSAGHQPMASASGDLVIVFNGEIYNHAELRARLESAGTAPARGWRGHSDTETLLECMAAWGVRAALEATVGMFALAVWDRSRGTLTLARDRFGEKPLYFGWQGGAFLFASELKALRVHPAFSPRMDREAAGTMLQLGYIPAPATIYQGIRKLPPGTFLALETSHLERGTLGDPVAYWSLDEAARRGEESPYRGSYAEAVEQLDALIRQSVQLQSVADVPVGAFLSGGIDSSTVVALMQKAGARVTTFSIGMPDAGMDEGPHAAAVAAHLGTDHVAHQIQPREALEVIPRLWSIWDEPFADSSQIPTYLVSRLARERVTVALSGDGGDEIFLGYPQYPKLQELWEQRTWRKLPWDPLLRALSGSRHRRLQSRYRKMRDLVAAWRQADARALNRYWMNPYRNDPLPLRNGARVPPQGTYVRRTAAETAGVADAAAYLPDDILVKVDRAAMANSLETRAPLLDHRVVEFALALPIGFKLEGQNGKKVLRDVLYRHVPRHLVDRPKMGFSIPLHRWLRSDLREWGESVLARIPADSELIDRRVVEAMWNEHQKGTRDRTQHLWHVLCLVSWCHENGVTP